MAVSACKPDVVIKSVPLPIPAERMDCVAVDKSQRPKIGGLHVIDWANVKTVGQAQLEVTKLLESMINRETTVSHYVVDIENKLFLCASDAQWLREYVEKVEK